MLDENIIGNTALGRASFGKLFWDDEACHRTSSPGRRLLFYRELSFDDVALRSAATAAKYARCGPRFSRLWAGPKEIGIFSAIGCVRSDRIGVDVNNPDAHGL